ncbi:DUF6197 family protein [Actinomadura rupiterrae]|uniref:DUF6197 family protein n=1 Tax=Actinomadura rupiterrae TaxID=559627 RepID=UPI0020A47C4A|nr:hypothetical protein [Actinomadura rupiterrae]MCP2339229.1 hypothetical protein [Actinomadura rupiterrae]
MRTSEILLRAAEVIETRGWHQGTWFPDPLERKAAGWTRDTCPVCVLAAINIGAGNRTDFSTSFYDWEDVPTDPAYVAAVALADWLSLDLDGDLLDVVGQGWNDHPDRTQEEVTAALRCAAEAEDARGAGA